MMGLQDNTGLLVLKTFRRGRAVCPRWRCPNIECEVNRPAPYALALFFSIVRSTEFTGTKAALPELLPTFVI